MLSTVKASVLPLSMLAMVSVVGACGNGVEAPVVNIPAIEGPTLAAGEFNLRAAGAFGEPGFHEDLSATHILPQDLDSTADRTLVLKLKDAGRSSQTCSQQHPLSGCATVDWSDSPDRPKVPSGGVFENRVTLQLVSGVRRFYLSESGSLNEAPDPFKPG